VEQLACAGVLAVLLPVFNLAAWHGGMFTAFATGDLAKGGIDVGLLLIGAGLLWAARKVNRHVPAQRRMRAPRASAATATGPGA